jgi:peptidoglycan/LPS O-acetylase OafA/YrhL
MPEPVKGDQKYLPGLDGLRALAVAAVVAFHLGYGWAQGGLLGVGVFFTLSGYLITDVLVGQWAAHGRIRLGNFWLRRARRLLPALFVMLAVVTVWVNTAARSFVPGFRGNVVASVLYVSNWWYIGQHASYYARFAPPEPLDHLWSLAVEEQFYLVWPLAVLLILWLAGRARSRPRTLWSGPGEPGGPVRGPAGGGPYLAGRGRLLFLTLTLAAVSMVLMACLYQPGLDPTRVYEGTDTRAFGLLMGAALAIVWPTRRPEAGGASASWTVPAGVRWLLDAVGIAGLAVIALLVWRTNEYSGFMFRGGLVLLSAATAAAVAAAVTPGSLLGRVLGVRPLRWVGVRSYGIYLWHYPVVVLTAATGAAGGPVSPERAAEIIAVTVAAAAVSWRFIEDPVRRGARLRWVAPASTSESRVSEPRASEPRAAEAAEGADMGGGHDASGSDGGQRPGWPRRPGALRSPLAAGGLCLLAAAVLAGCVTAVSTRSASAAHPAAHGSSAPVPAAHAGASTAAAAPTKPATASGHSGAPGSARGSSVQTAAPKSAAPKSAAKPAAAAAPRTSCSSVVHIGDSTSEGLTSADYLPNPKDRITARYADVGVKHSIMDIVGATSVVEALPGTPNADEMATQVLQGGYHGCWVLALGTNDTADVYVGSYVDRVQRIQEMMKLIGNQPVMWVEVTSLLSSGPYSEQNMQLWNQALKEELPHYPSMRIYNWPAAAQQSWFISDGIHYTSTGYEHRAVDIADALATAFPAS